MTVPDFNSNVPSYRITLLRWCLISEGMFGTAAMFPFIFPAPYSRKPKSPNIPDSNRSWLPCS